jgi:hypothetical protein
MRPDTWERLAAIYAKYPALCAQAGASRDELDAAAARLGVPLPAEYREFVVRFGGGHAGSLPVAGLREWGAAGAGEWSVVEKTERFRAEGWPGTQVWAVFSDDGFGNPVGFDAAGRVWLSDHDDRRCVCLEARFEDWLRRWALHVDPHRAGGYLACWDWPS